MRSLRPFPAKHVVKSRSRRRSHVFSRSDWQPVFARTAKTRGSGRPELAKPRKTSGFVSLYYCIVLPRALLARRPAPPGPGRSRQDPRGVQDAQGHGRDTARTGPEHAHPARTRPGHGKDPARTPGDGQDTAETPAPRVTEATSPPGANEHPVPSARSEFGSTAGKSIRRSSFPSLVPRV